MLRRQSFLVCGLATFVFVVSDGAVAQQSEDETGFDFNSRVRTRYASRQDFDFDSGDQTYFLTQIRLGLSYKTENSRFFTELQDARIFGESRSEPPPIDDSAVPSIVADQLDIHQAYYEHDFGSVTLRAGRQKFDLGDRRLFGSAEWINTARVHDGVHLTLGDPSTRQIELFATKLVAVDPDEFNDQSTVGNRFFDSDFHGAFVADKTFDIGQLEYWYFYRRNADFRDKTNTVGLRLVRELGGLELDVQGSYQFGEFDGLDHSASMFRAGISGDFDVGSWSAAYIFGSGDGDANDGDHGTFDNLYPRNHIYYGFMDLFSLKNLHNLELVYARPIADRASLYLGWQNFWLDKASSDAWYSAGQGRVRKAQTNVDSYVGSEIDVAVTIPLIPGQLALLTGYSHFFGGQYLSDTGPDRDAKFFYLQLTWTP
ncbi:MAG: alginate export family protein [Candidatus Rariloculaceae bacterium]